MKRPLYEREHRKAKTRFRMLQHASRTTSVRSAVSWHRSLTVLYVMS
jgi:transposase-like protein